MPWQSRWRLLNTIDKDNVFKVQSLLDGTIAVLKTAPAWASKSTDIGYGDFRQSIGREIVSLERLHAAGAAVPRPLDHNLPTFRSSDAPLYIVMEYVEGVTLAKLGTIPPELLERIAATITTAHSLGIAHRDITPNNVIVRNGEPVVIDWSLSCHLNARGTPFASTAPEAWRKVAAGDLRSVERLPETLKNEFWTERA